MLCPKCLGPTRRASKVTISGEKKQRWECKGQGDDPECTHRTIHAIPEVEDEAVSMRKYLPESKRYIVTCLQNATPLHMPFWRALLQCAEHYDAELVAIPIRYQNPTSNFPESQKNEEWWAPKAAEYLFDGRQEVHERLTILGDIKTQLTAVHPVTGFESITGDRSAIMGHPKLNLRCIPTPHQLLPKIVTTTGTATVPNYTDSRAGKRGEFHHTYGASLVEIDGDAFHLRQLNANNNGSFYDLRKKFTPQGVEDAPPIEALVMGDTHHRFIDPEVEMATFHGPDSIMALLEPKKLVWHDMIDWYAVNPHTTDDPYLNVVRAQAHMDLVKDEIVALAKWLMSVVPEGVDNIVAPSNHNDFLSRWMKSHDWHKDPRNAEFFLETALEMVRNSYMGEAGVHLLDPFELWLKRLVTNVNMVFPRHDESITIRGIEVAMHGHLGPNGARGSLLNLSRIGVKSMFGHSHTPGIIEGAYQVGTSSRLRLDYNIGPSSWMNTHGIIYQNGKRALLNIINGRWRLT